MLWARVKHLRYAAGLAHALISFRPGREGSFGLGPMGDRGLVAPVQKSWHGFFVRPARHVLAHALLIVPRSHRPKSPTSVSQQRAFLESRCLLYLPQGAEGVKREEWKITNGSDSQAG